MACSMAFEGHVATVHVTLDDPYVPGGARSAAARARGFPEIFRGVEPGEREPEDLRKTLEVVLTDDARKLLESDDVKVEVTWEPGSLEIAAILVAGKIVADAGAFLAGVREIRDLFPERIRNHVSRWLGREVAAPDSHVEAGSGLLRAKDEEPKKQAADDANEVSLTELKWYAGLALGVLLAVTIAVIAGVAVLD